MRISYVVKIDSMSILFSVDNSTSREAVRQPNYTSLNPSQINPIFPVHFGSIK